VSQLNTVLPLSSSESLKLKGSMAYNSPLAQHRINVLANTGLSFYITQGATEEEKSLLVCPWRGITPGKIHTTNGTILFQVFGFP